MFNWIKRLKCMISGHTYLLTEYTKTYHEYIEAWECTKCGKLYTHTHKNNRRASILFNAREGV